jgi:thermitase
MNTMRTLLCVAGWTGLAVAAMAQTTFVEQRGVKEFTGQMIARPYTPTELQANGIAPATAVREATRAHFALERLTIRQDPEVGHYIIRVPAGSNENALASSLMKTGLYKFVEPNYRVFYTARPNDTLFAQQWQHSRIQSELAWDIHRGGPTIVGIVDSGVDTSHLDLRPNLLPGYNAADDKRQVDGGDVSDIDGHGTHVSGCAAAIGNNGRGVAGVGWGFRILPIRGSNFQGGLFVSDGLRGVRWAVDNGAKAVNCSWGGFDLAATQETGTYVKSKGGLMVFASGNSNVNLQNVNHPDVFLVGASTPADTRASFSNYGRPIDVFAPGEDILATTVGGGYGPNSGTSMASPIVAGLATLVWSFAPRLTPTQVENVITRSTDVIGPSSIFGFGRINSRKALLEAQKLITAPTVVLPTSVSVFTGTHEAGAVAALGAADGSVYSVRSTGLDRIGHLAAAIVEFRVPTPTRVTGLTLTGVHKVSSGQSTSGTVFIYNRSTARWDTFVTSPLSTLYSTSRISLSSASLSRYMGTNGQVQVMVRGYAQDTRRGGASSAFSLHLDQMVLAADILGS